MKKILLLLILLTSGLSFSQINYEAGYFIHNSGIRTACLIRNIAWKNNPREFEYKINETSETKTGTISSISEFSVGNSYKFKRFKVNIDQSMSTMNGLDKNKEPKWEEQTVFLKILVEGDLILFQFEDNNVLRFFFSSAPYITADQLVFKEFLTDNGDVAKNNQFRQQLYRVMKSPNLKDSNFEKLRYDKKELVKLFLLYNGSDQKTVIDFEAKQNKSSFHLKATAGINMGIISFHTPSTTVAPRDSKTQKSSFRVGLEAEMVLPFNQNKWSFFIAPNYMESNSDDKVSYWSVNVNLKTIEVPLGVRHYMFLNNKSRLFIDLGYALGFSMNSTATYKTTYNNHPSVFDIGSAGNLFTGLGFSYGRYSIEARYNSKRELLPQYEQWSSKYSGVSFTAGYSFL